MRIAAWVLIVLSALGCAFLLVIATKLVVPASDALVDLNDPHAHRARVSLLGAGFALANGGAVLRLRTRPRSGALWVVLFAGLFALVAALWHYAALEWRIELLVQPRGPDFERLLVVEQGRAWLRTLLAWAVLTFGVAGWAAWLVNRRITIGHGRD